MNDSLPNIAIYCDYENVAIGAKDAHYNNFDISLVLERLLDKGKIVVKKAYCDWERYKSAKRPMHEAAFELIEIPHVSYSGKNSADIRLVVDALDLCYTKAHVDMFVIVSGDSDFSPLVSKLRENDKKVIGLGIKSSSSDLLIENCDEFIYYDDLVRNQRKGASKKASKKAATKKAASTKKAKPASGKPADKKSAEEQAPDGEAKVAAAADETGSKEEAIELVLEIVEALFRDRDENLWGSMVKQTLKRKKPHFSETFHGYRTFNQLLEDAQSQGLLELQKDSKSGGYLITSFGPNA
jgi:uncharacterized protein (TIGR00288 family)